jgi:hypothetical protein
MKKAPKNRNILAISFTLSFLLLTSSCQTSRVNTTSDREPASAKHRPVSPEESTTIAAPEGATGAAPLGMTAEAVRIDAINGTIHTQHDQKIEVHPGDVITFSADVFRSGGAQAQAEDRNVEEFKWSADDAADDFCNASSTQDCLSTSKFQVNDYGVSYYVPYSMGQSIHLAVVDRISVNDPGDSIELINLDYTPSYVAPTQVVTSVDSYPCGQFNADCALAGEGRWVYIDSNRYFVPYTTDVQWAPFSHGSWSWVDGDGWTWISYDSWGWYTDHYGSWRHHGVYGWIWSPWDQTVGYVPAPVTWFYDGDHIGWYPYWGQHQEFYAWGEERGFDDGYWGGYQPVDYWSTYHPGFFQMRFTDFSVTDCSDHRATDIDVNAFYASSWSQREYGGYLGGVQLSDQYNYIHVRGINVTITQVGSRNFGSFSMRFPEPQHEVPAEYRIVGDQSPRFGSHPVAVGSIFAKDGAGDRLIPPTTNGRGIATPPVFHDRASNTINPLAPRTNNPARPNPENGSFHAPPPAAPHPEVSPVKVEHSNEPPATPPQKTPGNKPPVKPVHHVRPPQLKSPATPDETQEKSN